MVIRVMDVALGLWLCASAFAWPHGAAQFVNAVLAGTLLVVDAGMALAGHERARFANRALAIWLFVANLILPGTNLLTAWNHSLVAVMVFLFSMVPTFHVGRRAKVVAV